MNVYQAKTEVLQCFQIDRGVIDKGPGFSVGRDLPSEDDLGIVIKIIFCKKLLQTITFHLKNPFYTAFLLLVLQYGGISTLTQNQGERTNENGFTGSRFTCNNG